jgi:hypothetical protein
VDGLLHTAFAQGGVGDGPIDGQNAIQSLECALFRVSPALQEMEAKAKMFDQLAGQFKRNGLSQDDRAVKRVFVDQLAKGVTRGQFSQRQVSRITGVHRSVLRAAAKRDRVEVGESLRGSFICLFSSHTSMLGQRQRRSDAFGDHVSLAVREFVHCYSKFEEKTFVCLLTKGDVWTQYCKYHNKDGLYFPQGSLGQLDYERKLLQLLDPPPRPPQPLSIAAWNRLWPPDVTKDVWRSCCCTQCAEVEDLLDTWGYKTPS